MLVENLAFWTCALCCGPKVELRSCWPILGSHQEGIDSGLAAQNSWKGFVGVLGRRLRTSRGRPRDGHGPSGPLNPCVPGSGLPAWFVYMGLLHLRSNLCLLSFCWTSFDLPITIAPTLKVVIYWKLCSLPWELDLLDRALDVDFCW